MTIRELIEQLKGMDPGLEVLVWDPRTMTHRTPKLGQGIRDRQAYFMVDQPDVLGR
jgi:hypothetical protein